MNKKFNINDIELLYPDNVEYGLEVQHNEQSTELTIYLKWDNVDAYNIKLIKTLTNN